MLGWDLPTGRTSFGPVTLDHRSVAVTATGGRNLVVLRADGRAELRSASDGSLLVGLGTPAERTPGVRSVAASPDGKSVVTACVNGSAHLWDAATGAALAQVEDAGRRAATADGSGAVRLWDVASGSARSPAWRVGQAGPNFPFRNCRVAFASEGLLVAGEAGRPALVVDPGPPEDGDPGLPADELLRLAELNARAALGEYGGVGRLGAEGWLSRWQAFRQEHPESHPMPGPGR